MTDDHDVMPWIGIFIFVLFCLYVWADCIVRNYFKHKRRHHLNVLKDLGKERP